MIKLLKKTHLRAMVTETYGQFVMILSTMFSQTFGNVVSFGALGTFVDCIRSSATTGWTVIFGNQATAYFNIMVIKLG